MKELRDWELWWREELTSQERTILIGKFFKGNNTVSDVAKECYKRHIMTEKLKLL